MTRMKYEPSLPHYFTNVADGIQHFNVVTLAGEKRMLFVLKIADLTTNKV